jgi:hypothetical protein
MGGMQRWRSARSLTRADRAAAGAGLACLLAGALVLALAHGFAATLAGAILLGVAAIAFVALAFLLTGESEDRDYGKLR